MYVCSPEKLRHSPAPARLQLLSSQKNDRILLSQLAIESDPKERFDSLTSSLISLLVLLGTTSPTVMAEKKTIDLNNGAELSVDIANLPLNSTLTQGMNSLNATINGTASVGLGLPDIAYVYIVDTSGSTAEFDGTCGTELECIHGFLKNFNNETIVDGSAKLAAVIDFDEDATLIQGFKDPRSPEIAAALEFGNSTGSTNCTAALLAAKELVKDSNNTANTTVVIFASDGLCNSDDEDSRKKAIEALAKTGAIVHTVAVGADIDCDIAQQRMNNLDDFPANGGKCHSIPDPDTKLPGLVDDLIGTTLISLEIQVDGSNYTTIVDDNLSYDLPLKGANSTEFELQVEALDVGNHTICVRATGNDTLGLGTKNVVDCQEVLVIAAPDGGFEGWQVFLIVAFVLGSISFLVYAVRAHMTGKEAITPENELELEEPGGDDNETSGEGEIV